LAEHLDKWVTRAQIIKESDVKENAGYKRSEGAARAAHHSRKRTQTRRIPATHQIVCNVDQGPSGKTGGSDDNAECHHL